MPNRQPDCSCSVTSVSIDKLKNRSNNRMRKACRSLTKKSPYEERSKACELKNLTDLTIKKGQDEIGQVEEPYLPEPALPSGIIDTEATREPKEETKPNKQEEKKTKIIRNKGKKKVKQKSQLPKKEE
ncbi:hypothetical protein F8M41_008971 [Gigaspora margarita]|uniref:Uncharacterized protein n=1 Tax=Gigaspora margarita TaxID=4874 RepID=A0A8H4A280_GIGMA|nr:hypothetical protein F8M41_008971 [Gigaspora margarita]